MAKLTHIDKHGAVKMVDVTDKAATDREAMASGKIEMRPETLHLITGGKVPKGNVLETARIAGVMAAKRTSDLIPLCHPLGITGVELRFEAVCGGTAESVCGDSTASRVARGSNERDEVSSSIVARATVRVPGRTGVEMEALAAVSVALLTIYDMCKAVDRGMVIGDICLLSKSGGRSGTYVRGGLGSP